MDIKTRFNIGQVVFAINTERFPIQKPCGFCGGGGHIQGKDGTSEPCRRCFGHGRVDTNEYTPKGVRTLTIGQVRVETTVNRQQESYMMEETGVGSGMSWDVRLLYETEAEVKAAIALQESYKS